MTLSLRDIEMLFSGFVVGLLGCLIVLAKVRRQNTPDSPSQAPTESPAAKIAHDRGIEVFDD